MKYELHRQVMQNVTNCLCCADKIGVGAIPVMEVAAIIFVWAFIQGKCTEDTEGV